MKKETMIRLDEATLSRHFDNATSAAFLARQLTHVRAQTIQVTHAALNAFSLFPVQTEIPVGAQTALQRYYDMVGAAAIIADPADDLQRADIVAEEKSVTVRDLGAAYGYSVKDLENAAFASLPLDTMKAAAVRRSIDKKLNDIAFFGDSKYNITGFLENENLNEYTLAADGAGNSTKLSAKTAVQMYRDVTEFIETVPTITENTELMNAIGFAPASYNALARTLYVSDNGQTTQTVLQMLKDQHPEITRWLKIGELKGAGDNGEDIMIGGYFDPGYVRFEIPKRFQQLPVQEKNLMFLVNCLASTVGVTVSRPYTFTKAVGV